MSAPLPVGKTFLRTIVSFGVLTPLFTFGLLFAKGLPSFTAGHRWDVLIWVFEVTWLPACVSGVLMSLLLIGIRSRLGFFIYPYDIGRCFSLGAITGAVAEAISTWVYRALWHQTVSTFWIAGALIAGSLTGALVATFLLRSLSRAGLPRATA